MRVTGRTVDPIWPDDADALVHLAKRGSRKHFAVLELLIESIDWTQVVGDRVVRVRVEAESQWLPTVLPYHAGRTAHRRSIPRAASSR